MEELIDMFFDFNRPCSPEIVNCGELRRQYSEELKRHQELSTCSDCVMRGLRNKYLTFLMATNKINDN